MDNWKIWWRRLWLAGFGVWLLFPGSAAAQALYVNDAATAGDSFTAAAGDDANSGLTPSAPKLTIAAALALAVAGDTLYLDAGTYAESVSVTVSNLFIVGADSTLTILDPPGDSAAVTAFGVIADTGLAAASAYAYRVTAFDNAAPWANESFYSDSIIAVVTGSETPTITAPVDTLTLRAGDTTAYSATATDSAGPAGLTWAVTDTEVVSIEIVEATDTLVLTAPAGAAGATDTIQLSVTNPSGYADTDLLTVVSTYAADIDLDRDVDFDDLARVATDYGRPVAETGPDPDLDGSGTVDEGEVRELYPDYGARF